MKKETKAVEPKSYFIELAQDHDKLTAEVNQIKATRQEIEASIHKLDTDYNNERNTRVRQIQHFGRVLESVKLKLAHTVELINENIN